MTKEKSNMTNEYNFKVGDKVAINRSFEISINGYTDTIPTGEIGTVTSVCGSHVVVYFSEYHTVLTLPKRYVEPIRPLDRRAAFLTRLQSLLREFDAEICYREGDCELHIDLGDGDRFDRISYPFEYPDYDINDVGRLNLTADNIMDFDKEGVCR